MKGVFTQIEYAARGAILREADMPGMILGLPIATETKKRITLDRENDLSIVANVPKYMIYGDNASFNYIDGDILGNANVFVKPTSGTEYYELPAGQITEEDKLNYGTVNKLMAIYPVIKRTVKQGAKATVTDTTVITTGSSGITELESGDTIVITKEEATWYGLVGTVTQVGDETEASVEWKGDNPGQQVTGCDVIYAYYDYTGESIGLTRGFDIGLDMIVYRTSIKGVYTIDSPDDIYSMFGTDAPTNPLSNLAHGAFLYGAANSFVDKYYIAACDLTLIDDIEDETVSDLMADIILWTALLPEIDPYKNAYHLVPLSPSDSIRDLMIGYIDTASVMARKSEKHGYFSVPIINDGDIETDEEIAETFGNALYGKEGYTTGNKYANGYVKGEEVIHFVPNTDVESATGVPPATNNERVTFIGMEYAVIGSGSTAINIEGYYIAAIIAGWRSRLPLAYVMDDMAIPLISSIPCTGSYYSDDQRNALAASGWYMLYQDTNNGPVMCWLQMTTGYDSQERREQSFIVALDNLARDLRATFAPYTKGGLDNRISQDPEDPVTKTYLATLNSASGLVKNKYTVAQKVFAGFEVVGVTVNEMRRTATDIRIKVNHYYPAREIYITITVE